LITPTLAPGVICPKGTNHAGVCAQDSSRILEGKDWYGLAWISGTTNFDNSIEFFYNHATDFIKCRIICRLAILIYAYKRSTPRCGSVDKAIQKPDLFMKRAANPNCIGRAFS
jgi:hypothetical protein